jgi:hypothetical protein
MYELNARIDFLGQEKARCENLSVGSWKFIRSH